MNIVFCRYRNVCEPDYIDSFKMLGLEVNEVFLDCLNARGVGESAEALGQIFRKHTPIFVFTINYFPYISIVCESLGIIYVSLSVTCPLFEIYNKTIRNPHNRVFLFDHRQYLDICGENPNGIFYLPLGAATDRLKKANAGNNDRKYNISFVGSLYNEKDPFLKLVLPDKEKNRFEEMIDTQIRRTAYGQDYIREVMTEQDVDLIKDNAKAFYPSDMSVRNIDREVAIDNYICPHMTYIERVKTLNLLAKEFADRGIHLFTMSDVSKLDGVICHGGVETLTEMPKVFRNSRINLNLSTRSIRTGIPQRVWDVLGSRGFLLTNYQEEIPEYFEIGKHLETFESEGEMIEKISYYLSHEDERNEIADRGYEEVVSRGSVLNRVMAMISTINATL